MATKERAPSFWFRALVAFGWAATFHVTAFVLAFAWALVPLLLVPETWPSFVRWGGVLVTAVSGFVLLRSTVWVKDPFHPPSRALAAGEHRALQALVREVADTLKTAPPAEIFLVPDASASALEVRRGLFLRRRRVLVLGVGLLNTCTVSELRAALAHELGHFIGGDALLAPVLARVRHGLFRLHDEVGGGVLSLPLRLYAETFLRMTQSVSREQERWADRAAVRIAGARAHGELLRRQARADLLYALLLRSGVNVLVAAGLRPRNLYEGLRRFEQMATHDDVRQPLAALLAERPASPYDSHPSLQDRLALVESLDDGRESERSTDARLARELLDDAEAVEERVTRALFDDSGHLALVPIEWDEMAARAVRPALEEGARSAREHVARLFGPERAFTDEAALRTLLETLGREREGAAGVTRAVQGYDAIAETLRRALRPHVASLLAKTMLRRGGVLVADLGRPFVIRLDGREHKPDALAEAAVDEPAAARKLLAMLATLPPVEISRTQPRARGISDGNRKPEGEKSSTEG